MSLLQYDDGYDEKGPVVTPIDSGFSIKTFALTSNLCVCRETSPVWVNTRSPDMWTSRRVPVGCPRVPVSSVHGGPSTRTVASGVGGGTSTRSPGPPRPPGGRRGSSRSRGSPATSVGRVAVWTSQFPYVLALLSCEQSEALYIKETEVSSFLLSLWRARRSGYTQWTRSPWGERSLAKSRNILSFV